MAKDPVCGMNVDESKAQYTSEVNGQKVYLCREQCKRVWPKSSKVWILIEKSYKITKNFQQIFSY